MLGSRVHLRRDGVVDSRKEGGWVKKFLQAGRSALVKNGVWVETGRGACLRRDAPRPPSVLSVISPRRARICLAWVWGSPGLVWEGEGEGAAADARQGDR